MRKSVFIHQQSCQATQSKYGNLVAKFDGLPKETKTNIEIKNVGFEMAKEMVEQTAKGLLRAENQRLKASLIRM